MLRTKLQIPYHKDYPFTTAVKPEMMKMIVIEGGKK